MPHGRQNSKHTSGAGTIRKKTVQRGGKGYTYWEARFTTGFDPGTGKQKQRSITGKTQKEVAQKLRQATSEIDQGTYLEPSKLTLGDWLNIWAQDYLGAVKPRTVDNYQAVIKNHISPALGAIRLDALSAHVIQRFYNSLRQERDGKQPLCPKSIKNVHGVLHRALQQAVKIGYLRFNSADACTLPRVERKELKPLDEDAIGRFIKVAKGNKYEAVFLVTLFTGMRQGEVLGLTWDCVDIERNTIVINKQLQKKRNVRGAYDLVSTKNGKSRTITVVPYVIALLRQQRKQQAEWQLMAGSMWANRGLVFTNEIGAHLMPHVVYHSYKHLVASIGCPTARFHDLRHSYAVAAIRSGDDIKTVQSNLGHATASFTLDIYGHVTQRMKQESAARMEAFIKQVSSL